MKLRIRKSNLKRARLLGFLARRKKKGGRKVISRQRKRYGAYRGWDRK
jgi:ribosomal protein L34